MCFNLYHKTIYIQTKANLKRAINAMVVIRMACKIISWS